MFLDLTTLFVVMLFATAMSGILLVYSWIMNRHTPALALWAASYLVASAGTALIFARGHIDDVWSITLANALLIAAYGLLWMGARNFNRNRASIMFAFVGVAVWLAACQFDSFHVSISARIALVSAIITGYTLAVAIEFWRNGDKHLMARWPLIVILVVHAGIFFSRVLWPGWLLFALSGSSPALSVVMLVSFEILFHTFCAAFLLACLVKERAELRYRRASLVDPLTGVANRRGFDEHGTRLLQRLAIDHKEAAIIAFDLDSFKSINDKHGHAVGDRVLAVFCDVVSGGLRPTDLFARIGGEEFACLLPCASDADAVVVAERIRERFAKTEIVAGAVKLHATLSAGVALARQHRWNLTALMVAADEALYRAKDRGRNRVEFEWPAQSRELRDARVA